MCLRQKCFDSAVNKTILKPRLAAPTGRQYVYVGFSRRKIPRSSAYTMSEKAIRFRHPVYNPDRAQKLISSSMSRRLSTCNISSKSMYAFLSNLANRQTDRQTNKHGQKHLPPPLSEVTRWIYSAISGVFVTNQRQRLLVFTNRKSHTGCRFVPVSMNDL